MDRYECRYARLAAASDGKVLRQEQHGMFRRTEHGMFRHRRETDHAIRTWALWFDLKLIPKHSVRLKPISAEIFCRISNRIFYQNRIVANLHYRVGTNLFIIFCNLQNN